MLSRFLSQLGSLKVMVIPMHPLFPRFLLCLVWVTVVALGSSLFVTASPPQAKDKVKDIVALVIAAVAATESQDWARAADLYRQAVELEPNNSGLYNNWGVVLRRQGDLKGAIRAYQRALELDPNLDAAYLNLGLAYLVERRWEEALAVLTQAEERLPNEATLSLYKGIALEKLGRWGEAIAAYGIYVQRDPNALGHYRLAIAYWQSGNPQRAAEFFQRAARMDPQVGLYSAEAGRALAFLKQYQDAATLLERLPSSWLEVSDFLLLSRIAHRLNRPDLAERALQRALDLADGEKNSSLLNDAGVLAAERQDWQQAEQFLEAALAASEGDPQMLAVVAANLADLYLSQGRLPEALQQAQRAVLADPNLPQAHNTLAAILMQQQKLDAAVQHWQEAVQLDPLYWQAYRNLAIAQALRGETEQAVETMQQAMQKAPTLEIVQQLNSELQRIPGLQAGLKKQSR